MTYSKNQIKRAGRSLTQRLRDGRPFYKEDIDTINYWRKLHLEVLQDALKEIDGALPYIDSTCIAGRIKKLDTIANKLVRLPDSCVTSFRDIAGVRIIVSDMDTLKEVQETLSKSCHCEKTIDYINHPKESGYRAVHFEYRYDLPEYKNLRVEIQLRTQLQHSWATAIELYDYSRPFETKLKFSQDTGEVGKFFKAVSELIALKEQGLLYKNSPLKDRLSSLEDTSDALKIIKIINNSSTSLITPKQSEMAEYICFILNQTEQYYEIRPMPNVDEFFNIEKTKPAEDFDIVLIHTNTAQGLENLYPNYLGDARHFISLCNDILEQ